MLRQVSRHDSARGNPITIDSWPARKNVADNPFQFLLSEALAARGWRILEFSPLRSFFRSADLWHWHWPDGHFSSSGPASALARYLVLNILLVSARVRGIPVVWTAHNLGNHEGRNIRLERLFQRHFHASLAGVHYLSDASREEAERRYPMLATKPNCVVPHGHYRSTMSGVERGEARRSLGLAESGTLLAFTGKIRRYKGVELLLKTFAAIDNNGLSLVIAGAVGDDSESLLRKAAASDPRVHLILKHLTEHEMSSVISAADLVVLPYTKVLNSGSALLALSLDRPVMVPTMGSIVELQAAVGPQWVMTYSPPLDVEGLHNAAVAAKRLGPGAPNLEGLAWPRLAAMLGQWLSDRIINEKR